MTDFNKPTGREVRVAVDTWPMADMAIRADGDGMTFNGYAAVFNSDSEPLPWVERIRPGAFAKSLQESGGNIRMFLNHNADHVLATTRASTLSLSEDDRGLRVEAKLPDTQAGRDLSTLMQRGDVDSMSFGFQTIRDAWSEDNTSRELIEVRLFEVSPVTGWPAYPATTAFVRHIADMTGEDPSDVEETFRVLRSSDETFTDEQWETFLKIGNARRGERTLIAPTLAAYREKFASRAA